MLCQQPGSWEEVIQTPGKLGVVMVAQLAARNVASRKRLSADSIECPAKSIFRAGLDADSQTHRSRWTRASDTCTLPVRPGFNVSFTNSRGLGGPSPMATTSIEVAPDGAGSLEAWLVALRHREGADHPVLAEITEQVFSDIKPTQVRYTAGCDPTGMGMLPGAPGACVLCAYMCQCWCPD